MPSYLTQNEQEKCVMARISRQRQRYQANFTLARYGTWEKANRAARKWVREILPTLPERISSKGLKTTRNTSGVVGVRLANATRSKNGREYPDWRWVAFWNECPQSGGIGWSVNKYGDEGAFICACLARQSESIDRAEIEKKYARLIGTKRYTALLAQKKLSPPPIKAAAAAKAKAPARTKPAEARATKASPVKGKIAAKPPMGRKAAPATPARAAPAKPARKSEAAVASKARSNAPTNNRTSKGTKAQSARAAR